MLGSDLAGSIGEPPRRVGQNGLESSFHCRKWSDFRRGSQSLGHSLDVPEIDLVCHPWVFYADGYRSRPTSSSRTPDRSVLGAGGTGADRALPRRSQTTVSSTPTGTFRVAGCDLLQTGTVRAFGDRIPVPDGVERPHPHKDVPSRDDMSPVAQDVPTRDNMSPNVRSAPARAVGLDHECASSHQPPGSPHLRRLAVHPSQPPRAGHRQKQAAPHLRCGAAAVSAPVQARCAQCVGESSPVRPAHQPQRVVIGRPQLVGYFCPIPHPDDEEADCE